MYKYLLWLLKIGALLNIYFYIKSLYSPISDIDLNILLPAQILFIVSAYRCIFPVRYNDNIVLHNSFLSSIFFTRFLATFVEVAYIYQFSYILRLINNSMYVIIDLLAWLMVLHVIISQFFVWIAIICNRKKYYYYEEIGWAIIFIYNSISSLILYISFNLSQQHETLLLLNLLFGIFYLPWQIMHLNTLKVRYEKNIIPLSINWHTIRTGLSRSIKLKNQVSDKNSWGGFIGLTWMICYWATVIPIWVYYIIYSFSL